MVTKNKTARGRLMKGLGVAAVAAMALAGCANGGTSTGDGGESAAEGEVFEFTLANGALEGTPHAAIMNAYLDLVEEKSEGRITFERTAFEALCSVAEVVDCVRDGRADIGATVPDYTPQLFPSLSVVGIPFQNTDIQATTEALYEMHTTYEPVMQQFEQNGLQYVATWPVGTMFIGSKEPIESVADFEGLRGRASGPVTQATLENAGMSINAITAPETYESLQRGVIDTVAAALDFAVNYKVNELLPHWTDPGMGQYSSYGMWWSTEAYDSLPDDLKAVVDEATAELNGGTAIETYNETIGEVCEGMLSATTVESFTRWDESATQEWRDAVGSSADELWVETAEGYGMQNAQDYLDEYKSTYDSLVSPDNPQDAAVDCVDRWQEQNG